MKIKGTRITDQTNEVYATLIVILCPVQQRYAFGFFPSDRRRKRPEKDEDSDSYSSSSSNERIEDLEGATAGPRVFRRLDEVGEEHLVDPDNKDMWPELQEEQILSEKRRVAVNLRYAYAK